MMNINDYTSISDIPVEAKYPIPVMGKEISLVRKRVPLGLLRLDPTNQRIQYLIKSSSSEMTEEKLEELMWDKEEVHVKNLAHSIEMNGGIMDPLLITTDGIVVEGNSRLVALRRIKKRREAKGQNILESILCPPCQILPDYINRTDLLWVLAEFHIAGKNEWDAYEQAEAVYSLHFQENQPLDKIAQHLRKSQGAVKRMLDAYKLMTEYLGKHPGGGLDKWSYFEEIYKKKELVKRLNTETSFKQEIFSLIKDKKLKGADVRKLHLVLENPEAKKVLHKQNFDQAFRKLTELKPSEGSGVYKSVSTLIGHLINFPSEELYELKLAQPNDERLVLLSTLSDKLNAIFAVVREHSTAKNEVASAES